MKASPASVRLELVVAATGETLEVAEDRRILAKLGLRDKAVLNAKLSQVKGWRWAGGQKDPGQAGPQGQGRPQCQAQSGKRLEVGGRTGGSWPSWCSGTRPSSMPSSVR
jgi:hypothetical protein